MAIALQLAPENRFVLRAASRSYTHFGSAEYIYDIIKRSQICKYDPWIMSAEISLATILNKTSRLANKGVKIIESANHLPHNLTELAASLGTLEFFHGNSKKTKRMFKHSLIAPNDNSLAQAEWISNHGVALKLNLDDYEISNKYEALTLDNYYNGNFLDALTNSLAWFCDMPFSRSSIIFSSHIAGSLLDRHDLGISILLGGLESHPNDPPIINNLVFLLALENRLDEAEEFLGRISDVSNVDEIAEVCLTATRGLIAFRRGNPLEGRKLYYESIEKTDQIKNNHLKALAILNYIREELLSNSDIKFIDGLMERVDKISIGRMFPDAVKLKSDVIQLYKRMRERGSELQIHSERSRKMESGNEAQ
jgi:hypothetical protein